MPTADDIRWFKEQFHKEIEAAVAGTVFDVDMLTALACQETGEIWPILRKDRNLSNEQIVALCVGDTLDAGSGRGAFPRDKGELVAAPKGQAMFDIARQALVDMAVHIPSYRSAARNANKFVHGFGVWQFDLQFFKSEPEYFLEKRYEKLGATLGKAIAELRDALNKIGFGHKASLDDMEMAFVGIAYNTGGFKPSKGLKQGFFDGTLFYGEALFRFIRLARTVALPGGTPVISPPDPGISILPPPGPMAAVGPTFHVDTQESALRLRSAPKTSKPTGKNVIANLPDGHPVRAVTGTAENGFVAIETSLFGANLRGFASERFLSLAPRGTEVPISTPNMTLPNSGIVAVTMPRKEGTITRRRDIAGSHSLNEPNQPSRTGATPAELVNELRKIIAWLAVDKPAHKRYRPRDALTFCNVYTHDYCYLAGAYLPRVWWTQAAIRDLTQGKTVQPLIEGTITEVRANDIFRWLRDFGLNFGWRQTGTLTKLQEAANQGALGLIIARRKQDGRSGRIVMVVPETGDKNARRNAAGEVIAPLQSQAGAVNFRYGTGKLNWWNDDRFTESAFWIHG
jgi:hypothetical protein